MRVIAIARLGTPIEREAEALAADLGTLAYGERLKLSAGLPAIVLSTPDEARAESLLQNLRRRGHEAIACLASDVVPSGAMISLRRFRLDDDALVASDQAEERLPWNDISALLRATQRTRTQTVDVVKEKKFDLPRALATGGLIRNRTTKREVSTRSEVIEPVLYLFRRSGKTPFILREQGTHYGALGSQLEPTAPRNFKLTVDHLRARAPLATFDERLLTRKCSPQELDLLAHLLALSIAL